MAVDEQWPRGAHRFDVRSNVIDHQIEVVDRALVESGRTSVATKIQRRYLETVRGEVFGDLGVATAVLAEAVDQHDVGNRLALGFPCDGVQGDPPCAGEGRLVGSHPAEASGRRPPGPPPR